MLVFYCFNAVLFGVKKLQHKSKNSMPNQIKYDFNNG